MSIKPLGDKIVVERLEAKEKTSGGIVLHDTAKENNTKSRSEHKQGQRCAKCEGQAQPAAPRERRAHSRALPPGAPRKPSAHPAET